MHSVSLYGVGFSAFLRSIRLLLQFKHISHTVTLAPFGEALPLFTDAHATLHPFKKMPVLIDGELSVTETTAIANYIAAKPGEPMFPADPVARAEVDTMAQYMANYIVPAVTKKVLLEFAIPKGADGSVRIDVVQANLPEVYELLAWLQTQLEGKSYLVHNRFSFADALLIPVLDYCEQLPPAFRQIHEFPALMAYLEFQREQPYCKGILGPAHRD